MIPVKQTMLGSIKGNCFQASVASVLEVPLESVPHFCLKYSAGKWFFEFKKWLEKNHGMTANMFLVSDNEEWLSAQRGYSLAGGKSPRGDFMHSVVYLDGKIIHDPHPSNDGIDGLKDMIVFSYIDPSKEK